MHEYLRKTESAARKLIEGITEYHQIFRRAPSPVFTGSFGDDAERDRAFLEWQENNRAAIERSFNAQRDYFAETLAKSSLCGALLQIAFMGIRRYGIEDRVEVVGLSTLPPGASRFAIGRRVRTVPIGLVIYAGRNQFHHYDDDELRAPTPEVFAVLAANHENMGTVRYTDPAFDLAVRNPERMAGNIVSLLGWSTYDAYREDMNQLLKAEAEALG